MITWGDLYTVLTAVIPLYVAMILAYGSVRWWKIFSPDQCSGINRFVAIFAVPLLSFHFISENDPYSMNFRFIAADTLQKIIMLVVLTIWTNFTKNGSLEWMITIFSLSTLPNTLVMGIPLLKAMYGDYSGSLMVQVVVLQCIIWYTLLLFLFEYRGAKMLIMEQFPETAASIVSFKVDSDVVSLDGRDFLETDAEIGDDGKLHIKVRKSNASRRSLGGSAFTPRPSNLTGAEIYSLSSSRNPTPRGSNFNNSDLYSMMGYQGFPAAKHSNSDLYSVQSSRGPTEYCGSNTVDDLPEMSGPQNTAVLAYPVGANSQSVYQLSLYPITIKFEEVVYKVKLEQKGLCYGTWTSREKTILNGLTGLVSPGEILAMLGPSGSGKTTLLTALGGRLNGKLSGKITYNGQPFSGTIKRRTGFVSQDDVLYPHLTVAETLLFTALLRLPSSLARDEKEQHVERVITELGLTKCRNSMIGGPLFRGISGGEKKRVSIGQEMLINPSLLLLDEPTSGLDSTTAQRILTTIKRLAGGGRTVVTTIHQPSSRIYHMFDKVILLSEGCPIYYGSASAALEYFSSIGFSTSMTVNPADLLLDLANGIAPDSKQPTEQVDNMEQEQKLVKEALISAYDKNISTRLKAELCSSDVNNFNRTKDGCKRREIKSSEQWCTSWWHQFRVLLQRGLRERRFEAFNRLRIFQVLSVAVLGGLLWLHTPTSHIEDRIALLFFFSVFWGFYPLYNAVFTFPQERRMLIKERSSGMYRLSSYFLARTVGDLPLELALPTAFVFIIYWMGGLKPNAVTFILSLLIVLYSVLVSQSLGLAIGAILMDVKQATTLASVTTLVFLIAGGYYIQQIPPFIVWLKYLSYSYYCYKLLLGVQYKEDDYYECSKGVLCRVGDFPAVKSMDLNHLWVDVAIMGLMLVGYRLVAYLALHRVQLG